MRLGRRLRLKRITILSGEASLPKTIGILLVATGVAIILTVTPGWVWLMVFGAILAWQGWLLISGQKN